MRKFMSRNLIVASSLAILSMNGICQSPSNRQSTKPEDVVLVSADRLKIELQIDIRNRPAKALVLVSNGLDATIWFPIEPTPSYKPDEKSRLIKIWFGYFEEIHGTHKAHYMLPAMRPVHPGETSKFELTSPPILEKIFKKSMKPEIQVRVATKSFTHSRIRNNQPLEDYINNSLVVDAINSAKQSDAGSEPHAQERHGVKADIPTRSDR